jgi:hypothetical protein
VPRIAGEVKANVAVVGLVTAKTPLVKAPARVAVAVGLKPVPVNVRTVPVGAPVAIEAGEVETITGPAMVSALSKGKLTAVPFVT